MKIKKSPWAALFPCPVVLVTCIDSEEKPNIITLAWVGVVCSNPPMLGLGIQPHRHSFGLIERSEEFVVNIPTKDIIKETDLCGTISGKDVDKSKVFRVFYGSVDKAPMIEECPVNIVCKLIQTFDLLTQEVFIGEVMETFVNKDCCEDDKPVLKDVNPLLLGGGAYWELGNKTGDAFKDGKALVK